MGFLPPSPTNFNVFQVVWRELALPRTALAGARAEVEQDDLTLQIGKCYGIIVTEGENGYSMPFTPVRE
ncbi:hypothetical protein TM49_10870 [Martelella endophytica]|uniref:Uncharacterized protein n=1 Tax=Martelella endophytica TaxID=1486262 RepID=A0A0D5LQL9_MAREN|nr:hypothetical protein TM49_10870 [Martelella endophytica]